MNTHIEYGVIEYGLGTPLGKGLICYWVKEGLLE